MSLITSLRDELAGGGLRLRKAQPRGPGRLLLELEDASGHVCGGQWYADGAESSRVAAALRTRFGVASVDRLDGGRLVVQHRGADRRLLQLRDLVEAPAATLVAHRPERRAVVRLGTDRYVKVVRPGQTAAVVDALASVPPAGLRVPEVVDVDDDRGLVTLAAIPGPTLLHRLVDPLTDDALLAEDARRIGAAVRSLHESPARATGPVHDRAAEVRAAHRWLDAASDHGLLDRRVWTPLLDGVGARLPAPPPRLALLHRDLHDKQVVMPPGGRVGLLDLDLATRGDPALDLANLLVHLDLRARQGGCPPARARACAVALLEGYAPDPTVLAGLPAYAASTRLRLAGVYSFRDSTVGLVDGLLDDVAAALAAPTAR